MEIKNGIKITDAYNELSDSAFALWMLLQVTPHKKYETKAKLAKLTGRSEIKNTAMMRELVLLNYIEKYSIENPKRKQGAKKIGYKLLKKAVITGINNFVSMANFKYNSKSLAKKIEIETSKLVRCQKKVLDFSEIFTLLQRETAFLDFENYGKVKKEFKNNNNFMPKPIIKKKKIDWHFDNNINEFYNSNNENNKITFVEQVYKKKRPPFKSINNININNILKDKNKRKSINNKLKNKRKSINNTSLSLDKEVAKNIDWEGVDKNGNPKVTFTPSEKKRAEYIKILKKNNNNEEKKLLTKKLGSEFARIYSRYRRELQRKNNKRADYEVWPPYMKHACRAAEHCIRKGVTPKELLAYWHLNISNFKSGDMTVPPLHFLSSPANIEVVACCDKEKLEKHIKGDYVTKDGNSFSDLNKYDVRVRAELKKAKFNVDSFSDKFLLSIQYAAKSLAQGVPMYVDEEIRTMAVHLSKTLYKDIQLLPGMIERADGR